LNIHNSDPGARKASSTWISKIKLWYVVDLFCAELRELCLELR
jgi:hypothetical protein